MHTRYKHSHRYPAIFGDHLSYAPGVANSNALVSILHFPSQPRKEIYCSAFAIPGLMTCYKSNATYPVITAGNYNKPFQKHFIIYSLASSFP